MSQRPRLSHFKLLLALQAPASLRSLASRPRHVAPQPLETPRPASTLLSRPLARWLLSQAVRKDRGETGPHSGRNALATADRIHGSQPGSTHQSQLQPGRHKPANDRTEHTKPRPARALSLTRKPASARPATSTTQHSTQQSRRGRQPARDVQTLDTNTTLAVPELAHRRKATTSSPPSSEIPQALSLAHTGNLTQPEKQTQPASRSLSHAATTPANCPSHTVFARSPAVSGRPQMGTPKRQPSFLGYRPGTANRLCPFPPTPLGGGMVPPELRRGKNREPRTLPSSSFLSKLKAGSARPPLSHSSSTVHNRAGWPPPLPHKTISLRSSRQAWGSQVHLCVSLSHTRPRSTADSRANESPKSSKAKPQLIHHRTPRRASGRGQQPQTASLTAPALREPLLRLARSSHSLPQLASFGPGWHYRRRRLNSSSSHSSYSLAQPQPGSTSGRLGLVRNPK